MGKIECRRSQRQRMRWIEGIINSMDMRLSKFQDIVEDREAWHAAARGIAKSWTRLSESTTTMLSKDNMGEVETASKVIAIIGISGARSAQSTVSCF